MKCAGFRGTGFGASRAPRIQLNVLLDSILFKLTE